MNSRLTPPAPIASRRSFLSSIAGAGMGILATGSGTGPLRRTFGQSGREDLLDEMVIDLSGTPESIDPALAYSPRDWSIVHSIYDAMVGFDANGQLVPLAAETFTAVDDRTFEVTLRSGLTFHDGSPVNVDAISRSVAYLRSSDSLAVDLFGVISDVEQIDQRTARIICDLPSPWLPAQMAVWLVLVPAGFTAEAATTAPVGSGPFSFVSYAAGDQIVLKRNEAYDWGSPKGEPLADQVRFRFVPDASTRIADLTSGAAHIVTDLSADQLESVRRADQLALESPIVGSAWIRIATDVEPFDDVRVRRALNHAVDAQAIATSLVSADSRRLGALYPDERALGFDPALRPYTYDPDKARSLLDEAGVGEGLIADLEITTSAPVDVAAAIAAQLGDVGIEVNIITTDDATFNAGWADASRPVLRTSTWVPLYDPQTLLSLVFASDGYLSRYDNSDVDALIQSGASETNASARDDIYQRLGTVMHEDAPAIFLWNLTSGYGVAKTVSRWQPRGDEYVIPTNGGDAAGS